MPVRQSVRTAVAARTPPPLPVVGLIQLVVEGPRLLGPSAAHPSSNLFGKGQVGRTRDHQSAGRDDWDTYARLLKLYLAGVGPSPSLVTLADEVEAYYSLAENRSGVNSGAT